MPDNGAAVQTTYKPKVTHAFGFKRPGGSHMACGAVITFALAEVDGPVDCPKCLAKIS